MHMRTYLNANDRPALCKLKMAYLWEELVKVNLDSFQIWGIGRSDLHIRITLEPTEKVDR